MNLNYNDFGNICRYLINQQEITWFFNHVDACSDFSDYICDNTICANQDEQQDNTEHGAPAKIINISFPTVRQVVLKYAASPIKNPETITKSLRFIVRTLNYSVLSGKCIDHNWQQTLFHPILSNKASRTAHCTLDTFQKQLELPFLPTPFYNDVDLMIKTILMRRQNFAKCLVDKPNTYKLSPKELDTAYYDRSVYDRHIDFTSVYLEDSIVKALQEVGFNLKFKI